VLKATNSVVECSPEKAGVGGSTPSLATIIFNHLANQPKISHLRFHTCACSLDRRRRTNGEHDKLFGMDEGRKRVLLIAASILAARKLAQFDGGKKVPATISAIADAVRWAEEIMKAIDERFPSGR
jgi:hypothetical protein